MAVAFCYAEIALSGGGSVTVETFRRSGTWQKIVDADEVKRIAANLRLVDYKALQTAVKAAKTMAELLNCFLKILEGKKLYMAKCGMNSLDPAVFEKFPDLATFPGYSDVRPGCLRRTATRKSGS